MEWLRDFVSSSEVLGVDVLELVGLKAMILDRLDAMLGELSLKAMLDELEVLVMVGVLLELEGRW